MLGLLQVELGRPAASKQQQDNASLVLQEVWSCRSVYEVSALFPAHPGSCNVGSLSAGYQAASCWVGWLMVQVAVFALHTLAAAMWAPY